MLSLLGLLSTLGLLYLQPVPQLPWQADASLHLQRMLINLIVELQAGVVTGVMRHAPLAGVI